VTPSIESALFIAFATGIVVTSLGVIALRNPVASAMALVADFFFLAGTYVLLWAHTIAVLQILVYAGAIMVLFLFVIMLLSLSDAGPIARFTPARVVGVVGVVGIFAMLTVAFLKLPPSTSTWLTNAGQVAQFGTIKYLGGVMYTQWLFPFESVSLLLLVAIVGAVVVAKSRI
jgi:NADH-quinone oxidoreductase subunit J